MFSILYYRVFRAGIAAAAVFVGLWSDGFVPGLAWRHGAFAQSAPQVVVQDDGKQMVTMPDGVVVEVSPDGTPPRGRRSPRDPGQPPKPGGPQQPGADGAPPTAAAGGANAQGTEGAATVNVQRPTTPPNPPDSAELSVEPNDEGLLRFHFRNQPWPDVLRWLAGVAHASLDWQELPGDYLNLATQRPYTIEETIDTINRALLLRGFTILAHEDVMLVAKVAGLNPALVPRVQPEQLDELPPNSFVRTSFQLKWLIAEQVNIELASMISTNGKLTPLVATNRIEAMDAVVNLRDIYRILIDEQSGQAMENLAREFVLQHAKASAIKLKLEEFLGLQNRPAANTRSSRSGRSMDPMQMMQQQMQQQMQQMQQQMQQQAQAGAAARPMARSNELYLIANDRTNSLIVHASPDKMAIIEAFVQRVDVPNEDAADFQRLNTRMKVFRLASLNPNNLVESLTAMDVLEPGTQLQVDEENNAIIVYASVADQYLIQSVVDRLDGSERSFEVIQLRRLQAEAVAGSIKFLMGAEDEDQRSSRRNYGYYDYYGGFGGRSSSNENPDKMRVGANVRDNQLLLWANPIEMEEVRNLLVKLGEVPPEGGRRDTVRVIDASRQRETFEYLQRLKQQWEQVAPNPLDIPAESDFRPPESPTAETTQPQVPPAAADEDTESVKPEKADAPAKPGNKITGWPDEDAAVLVSAQQPDLATSNPSGEQQDERGAGRAEANAPRASGQAPPVIIRLDARGNLVLQSEDTQALDRLEEYMLANRPPRKPYDIFKVKYARASWVTLNLEEYFEKQEDEPSGFYSFFYDDFSRRDKEQEQLGTKSPLRFIYDNDTNSIVVTGADEADRQTIKELIELWDVPEPKEEDKDRYTRLLKIRYSRAESIVNTIKEAYRDLLSATDKSVQNPGGDQEEKRSDGSGAMVQPSGGLNYSFKGKLSLGADTITNSILVSAEGQALMEVICDMIEQLDEAAKPEGNVEVYQLSSEVNSKSLERALRAILGTKSGEASQQQPTQQPQPNEQPAPASEAGGRAAPAPNAGNRRNRR